MHTVRPATRNDLQGIFAIYDEVVRHGVATFETIVRTDEQREEWFAAHPPERYPALVVEDPTGGAGGVAGWCGLSPWSVRQAYARTAENSVYVAPAWAGRGIGRALMLELIERARRETPVRVFIARITVPNPASIRLHESLGFTPIGIMRRCGEKLGRVLDVQLMDLHLDGGGDAKKT